ncbi:MAG: transposase [Bdellovibrionota bacterium]
MGRKILQRTDVYPYHVNVRTNNGEFFPITLEKVWDLMCNEFSYSQKKYGVDIISFVMMSNHLHLIVSTPNMNLDLFMALSLRQISRNIGSISNKSNHLFGNRYHWSIVKNELYFSNVYRYVFQNPIYAGISKKVEQYRFSTLYYEHNNKALPLHLCPIPVQNEFMVPQQYGRRIQWLNEVFPETKQKLIEIGLRNPEFYLPSTEALKPFDFKNKFSTDRK